jgi:glutathione synthase/RimK-type ligase-like ATP-grasp enzyme
MRSKKKIFALIDYKGYFGSKVNSVCYRSGMDLELLSKYFRESGYELEIIMYGDVDLRNTDWSGRIVIYTSQEDPDYSYKGYIEDIIYALELSGAIVIPSYRFLRADNNKVFMELLRDIADLNSIKTITSHHFGCYEEFMRKSNEIANDKIVIKKPSGAKSHGVYLSETRDSAIKIVKRISKSPLTWEDLKDRIRPFRHKGYKRNSYNRNKFLVQNFVPGLKNDWKILVFGNKFFIEYRGTRDNDFRASGSQKFLFDDSIFENIPEGIFKLAEQVRNTFNVPHFSLDIGYIEGVYYLFEFQALYFSSYAQWKSDTYFTKQNNEFIRLRDKSDLEQLYAESIVDFLEGRMQ